MEATTIIRKPLVTEKSTVLQDIRKRAIWAIHAPLPLSAWRC